MKDREKILVAAVGLLILLIGAYYGYGRFSEGLLARQRQNARLQTQIERLENTMRQGARADRIMEQLQQRSLPADQEVARSLYQSWLLEAVGKVGLADPQVRATGGRAHGKVYYRLSYSVNGRGTLGQLVQFLYDFYAVDDLHQIRRLGIRPIPDSRELELSLNIEAAVLPGSQRGDAVANVPAERLRHTDLEAYREVILGRNLFAPPNNPPRLASIGSKEVALGRSLSFTASARDPDPLDQIRYRLGDDAPPDASLSESSGSFRWTPDQLGEYSVTVVAFDNGMPSKSDAETFRITVVRPPPPPPPREVVVEPPKLRFDDAKHTYVTAITRDADGREQIWLTVRTTGQVLKLYQGDQISVGSVRGRIRQIDDNDIEIETDRDRLLVSLGENLFQGTRLSADGL